MTSGTQRRQRNEEIISARIAEYENKTSRRGAEHYKKYDKVVFNKRERAPSTRYSMPLPMRSMPGNLPDPETGSR